MLCSHKVNAHVPPPSKYLSKHWCCINEYFRSRTFRSRGWQPLFETFKKEWIMSWAFSSSIIHSPGFLSEANTRYSHKSLIFVSYTDKIVTGKVAAPTKISVSDWMINRASALSFWSEPSKLNLHEHYIAYLTIQYIFYLNTY